jgi:hypothetical protein
MTIDEYLKMPEKYIPQGMYCYDSNYLCPFWSTKPDEYPEQENGYCHYLGKSDWDINHAHDNPIVVNSKGEEVEIDFNNDIDPKTGKMIHFPSSLIWDQCKECDVNPEDPEDIELVTIEMNEDASKQIKTILNSQKNMVKK